MGPGPTEIHPRVLTTMSQPAIGYLDPVFVEMMEELKALLRYTYQTENPLTFPISGPGSVGMEYCFVNLVAPGDKVIVCRNGVFGGRMLENVERCGGIPIVIDDDWGKPVDPQKVEDAFVKNPGVKVLAFVHAETSTGAQSDAKTLAQIAHKHDALVIADAVTSLGGTPVRVDDWKVDAIYSASQKCLSCTPGLSPVSFSERVVDYVKNRKDKIHSWFMDMNLLLGYWGATTRTYHPHGADELALRAARGAPPHQRGRAGEFLGPPPPPPHRAQGRARKRWAQVPGRGEIPVAADERGDRAHERERGAGAQDAAVGIQPRDRRGARALEGARSGASA
jgi:alanine-glyoxylate transaminase/serine-glyoxylate transaminase/serine-pyruvate transaminase